MKLNFTRTILALFFSLILFNGSNSHAMVPGSRGPANAQNNGVLITKSEINQFLDDMGRCVKSGVLDTLLIQKEILRKTEEVMIDNKERMCPQREPGLGPGSQLGHTTACMVAISAALPTVITFRNLSSVIEELQKRPSCSS